MSDIVVSEGVAELLSRESKFPMADAHKNNDKVLVIKEDINLSNTLSIINLGNDAQSSISEFVSNELSSTKAESVTTDNMQSLGLVIDEIRSVKVANVKNEGFWSSIPIIGDRIAYTFNKVSMQFDSVKDRVSRITDGIKQEMVIVDQSVSTLDVLDGKYRELIDELELYIAAGESKMQDELKTTFLSLKEKAESSGDIRDIEEFNAHQGQLVRLNQRVTNMMISRQVAIESLPVIRALQGNFLQFKEEFTEVINTVIPMWERQFLLAIEQNKQGKMLKISKSVKDYSNKQYLNFKEQMYTLEKDIGATLSRGIIDPETLQLATQLTCDAIEEHKKRLELTHSNQERTKSAIRESQQKLQEVLLK